MWREIADPALGQQADRYPIPGYMWREIADPALDYRVNLSLRVTLHYMVNAREKRKCLC